MGLAKIFQEKFHHIQGGRDSDYFCRGVYDGNATQFPSGREFNGFFERIFWRKSEGVLNKMLFQDVLAKKRRVIQVIPVFISLGRGNAVQIML